jgi:hypothetical protein
MIVRVGADGRLTAELVPNIPTGRPVDDITRLERAPRVVAGLEATSLKSVRVDTSREFMAEKLGTENLTKVKPSPNYHSEMVRYAPTLKNLRDNLAIVRASKLAPTPGGEFIISQILGSVAAVETLLAGLVLGEKLPLDNMLLNKGVLASMFGKLGSSVLNIRADTEVERLLFSIKGQNWLYVTGKELLTKKFPQTFWKVLTPYQRFALNAYISRLGTEFENIPDNPKIIEELEKLQLRLPGPWTSDDSVKILQGIPPPSRSAGRFREILELAELLIQLKHFFPPLGTDPEDFFKKITGDFRWSRFENLSPRETLKNNLGNDKLHELKWEAYKDLLQVVSAAPNVVKTAGKYFDQLLKAGEKKEVQDEKVILVPDPKGVATYLDEIGRFVNHEPDIGKLWFLNRPDAVALAVLKQTEAYAFASQFIENTKQKGPSFGTALSVLTPIGKTFLKSLASHPGLNSLIPVVESYLRSFMDDAFADIAVKRMAATLEVGGIYLDENEKPFSEFLDPETDEEENADIYKFASDD